MTIDEIKAALEQSHKTDLYIIKRYIAWVGFRRQMHSIFYFRAHWVDPYKYPRLVEKNIIQEALVTEERRKPLRVKFNAHWMNG